MRLAKRVKETALALVCLVVVIPIIAYRFPFTVGADNSYTVMSGSMSPSLSPGDLVIVRKLGPSSIKIGDMVTIESGEFTYTHRVVEKLEGDRLRLKGDANEVPDPGLVEASQIIGKVVLVFPFSHLYTPYGFAAAMLAPAALIIGRQVYTIHQHTKRRNRKETMRWRSKKHSALDTGTVLLALILTVSTTRIIAPHFIGGSSSYFSDVEVATGFFQAGIWVFPSTITCSAEHSPINSGDSVTISGSIDPSHSAKVTIFLLDGVSWSSIATVTSDSNGSYEYVWKNIGSGSYEIRASWEGDSNHYGALSATVTVSVEVP